MPGRQSREQQWLRDEIAADRRRRVVEGAGGEQVGAHDHARARMHLADHLDRIRKSWRGGSDEADRDGPAETLAQASGRLEALAHGARVVRTGRGQHDHVVVPQSEVDDTSREHGDEAIVGAQLVGEPGAPTEPIQSPREPRPHVEPRGEHERHDHRVGLGGGGERRGDVAVRRVHEGDGDIESGALGCHRVDEPDDRFAILRRRSAVRDGDEAKWASARSIAGMVGTARPDHVPPRAPRRSRSHRRLRR